MSLAFIDFFSIRVYPGARRGGLFLCFSPFIGDPALQILTTKCRLDGIKARGKYSV
jgi:hypothetical protein